MPIKDGVQCGKVARLSIEAGWVRNRGEINQSFPETDTAVIRNDWTPEVAQSRGVSLMVRIFTVYRVCRDRCWAYREACRRICRDGLGGGLAGHRLELLPQLAEQGRPGVLLVRTLRLAGSHRDVVEKYQLRGISPWEMSQYKPKRQNLTGVEFAVVTSRLYIECCLINRLDVSFPGFEIDDVSVVDKGDFPVVVVLV